MNWFTKRFGYAQVIGGVYRILNLKTGKCYVGSAQDVHHRWRVHYGLLTRGEHSPKLQAAWNDPTSIWVFGIIELVSKERLLDAENRWIIFYDSFNDGYNTASDAKAPMRGRKHAPETIASYRKRKANAAQRAVLLAQAKAPWTQEHRDNMSKSLKGRTFPHLKRSCKETTKKLMSLANKGKPPWVAIAKAAEMKRGTHLSEDAKQHLSQRVKTLVWIRTGGRCRRIPKAELNAFLQKGWKLGRSLSKLETATVV